MRYREVLLVLGILARSALADGGANDNELPLPTYFSNEMVKARKEYDEEASKLTPPRTRTIQQKSLSELTQELSQGVEAKSQSALVTLAAQVDALKSQVIVEKASLLATQSPHKVKVRGARTIFNYSEEALFEINAGVDHITDIQLQPGEQLTNAPMSGDTVRWNIGVMKSGAGTDERVHIIIKPLDEAIETNLIITTDRHIYQLRLRSGLYHMPSVSWNYPQEINAQLAESLKRKDAELPVVSLEQVRFNYDISGDDYDWKPLRVFDDGAKTFIQMPHTMRSSESPVFFVMDESGEPTIANYRIKGDYFVIDRLFKEAQLRVGKKDIVKIKFDDGRSFFARLFS